VAKRLSRKELYELVWSEPMKILAPRFGISDVALRKACARAEIPTPGPGHWVPAWRPAALPPDSEYGFLPIQPNSQRSAEQRQTLANLQSALPASSGFPLLSPRNRNFLFRRPAGDCPLALLACSRASVVSLEGKD